MRAIGCEKINGVENATRLQWLDALKGLGIVFVILSHLNQDNTLFFVITGPIMLPIFFFASGFTFNVKRSVKDFIKIILIQRLFLPSFWLSLGPLRIIKYILLDKNLAMVWDYCLRLLSGEVFWYLGCCIVAFSIFFFVIKVTAFVSNTVTRERVRTILYVLIAVMGMVMAHKNIFNFYYINTACTSQLYLFAGYCMKGKMNDIQRIPVSKKKICLAVSIVAYCILMIWSFACYPGEYFDLKHNTYYNVALVLLAIFTGNVALIQFFNTVKIPGFLVYIGKNSLIYYTLHLYAMSAVGKILYIMNVQIKSVLLYMLIVFFGSVIGCTIAAWIINRFMPFMVGRKSQGNMPAT